MHSADNRKKALVHPALSRSYSADTTQSCVVSSLQALPDAIQNSTKKSSSHSKLHMWTRKKKELQADDYPSILDGIKSIYAKKIKPLEEMYKFDQFYSPILRDSDFDAKPIVPLQSSHSNHPCRYYFLDSTPLGRPLSFDISWNAISLVLLCPG